MNSKLTRNTTEARGAPRTRLLGVPVAVLWPVSGGILLVAVGALALVAARAPATPIADRTVQGGAAV